MMWRRVMASGLFETLFVLAVLWGVAFLYHWSTAAIGAQ